MLPQERRGRVNIAVLRERSGRINTVTPILKKNVTNKSNNKWGDVPRHRKHTYIEKVVIRIRGINGSLLEHVSKKKGYEVQQLLKCLLVLRVKDVGVF